MREGERENERRKKKTDKNCPGNDTFLASIRRHLEGERLVESVVKRVS